MPHVRPLPKYAKRGAYIEAADFNAIIELLRSLDLSGGPGISVKKSSNGITISLAGPQRQATTSSGANIVPPFWLTQPDATHVRVKFGQVNGLTPTDVDTNIDVSGTDGTWSIYLHLTLGDDGIPTAAEVLTTTGAVPADTYNNAYMLIGEVDVVDSEIDDVRPSLAWSQTFVTCNRDSADPSTTPGTYYWELA